MGTPCLSPQTLNLAYAQCMIIHDIINVNKSEYLTPATQTRTRGSHYFKYFVDTSNDVFKYSYFPRTSLRMK